MKRLIKSLMWTDHTEYEEYQTLHLSTVVRYQHDNTLCKIKSNYLYRNKIHKYWDRIIFQYRTPLLCGALQILAKEHIDVQSLQSRLGKQKRKNVCDEQKHFFREK